MFPELNTGNCVSWRNSQLNKHDLIFDARKNRENTKTLLESQKVFVLDRTRLLFLTSTAPSSASSKTSNAASPTKSNQSVEKVNVLHENLRVIIPLDKLFPFDPKVLPEERLVSFGISTRNERNFVSLKKDHGLNVGDYIVERETLQNNRHSP